MHTKLFSFPGSGDIRNQPLKQWNFKQPVMSFCISTLTSLYQYSQLSYTQAVVLSILTIVNTRRACAARVTVLGLSVSVSTIILVLQATRGHQSDTNSSSATSDSK